MERLQLLCLLGIVLTAMTLNPAKADIIQNHFASITVNGKKVGQVHYTTRHDNEGILQELKTRASLSFLGREVYHHTLHTHEFWKDDELEHLWGKTNENGKDYQVDLTRTQIRYSGVLNKQPVELPGNAFPTAVWHYAIADHSLLFSIPELNLLKVKIRKTADSVRIGTKNVAAEKFEFSGDWKATVWFDRDKQFLKWQYKVKGRTVVVVLDP